MDEGWADRLDLNRPRAEVNVPGVIEYGKKKDVDVILWAARPVLTDRNERVKIFERYAAMGAKGFKIDFIERDDQESERFLKAAAADADVNAEHYVRREYTIKAGEKLKVKLAPGGGFAAKFTPR